MEPIDIIGIGCISSIGNNVAEVWNILDGKEGIDLIQKQEFDVKNRVKRNLYRKADRDSLAALYTVKEACKDSKVEFNDEIRERTGTIFSVCHGPVDTYLKFAEEVVAKDPEECSPSIFTNTVANAALGYICMEMKFKGVSTMLTASSNIALTLNLFQEEKADYICMGSIEAYCEELFSAIAETESSLNKNKVLSESVVTFLLQKRAASIESVYCQIGGFAERNFGEFLADISIQHDQKLEEGILRCMLEASNSELSDIDYVILSNQNKGLTEIERKVVEAELKREAAVIQLDGIMGDVLGNSLFLNIMIAVLSVKKRRIPKRLLLSNTIEKNLVPKKILVTGCDLAGNYISMIVKCKEN